MEKINLRSLSKTMFVFACFFCLSLNGQIREGKITYLVNKSLSRTFHSFSLVGLFETLLTNREYAPTGRMEHVFKQGKCSVVRTNQLGKSQCVIDGDSGMVLFDDGGKLEYISFTGATTENSGPRSGDYKKFKITSQTKIIEGFTCKKAKIKMKKRRRFTVWFTEDIRMSDVGLGGLYFKGISGVPLHVIAKYKRRINEFKVYEVNTEPVDVNVFSPSLAGYTLVQSGDKRYDYYYTMWADRFAAQMEFIRIMREVNY